MAVPCPWANEQRRWGGCAGGHVKRVAVPLGGTRRRRRAQERSKKLSGCVRWSFGSVEAVGQKTKLTERLPKNSGVGVSSLADGDAPQQHLVGNGAAYTRTQSRPGLAASSRGSSTVGRQVLSGAAETVVVVVAAACFAARRRRAHLPTVWSQPSMTTSHSHFSAGSGVGELVLVVVGVKDTPFLRNFLSRFAIVTSCYLQEHVYELLQ